MGEGHGKAQHRKTAAAQPGAGGAAETLVGTEPAARRGRRNVLPIVLLGAALLLGAAAGAVLFWFYRSAPPEGVIGYADGPTQIYVSGSPILVWLLGALAFLAGAGALVSFLLGRKGRQS